MENIMNINEKPIVDNVTEFLKTLTPEGQQAFWIFVQGAKFGTTTASVLGNAGEKAS